MSNSFSSKPMSIECILIKLILSFSAKNPVLICFDPLQQITQSRIGRSLRCFLITTWKKPWGQVVGEESVSWRKPFCNILNHSHVYKVIFVNRASVPNGQSIFNVNSTPIFQRFFDVFRNPIKKRWNFDVDWRRNCPLGDQWSCLRLRY